MRQFETGIWDFARQEFLAYGWMLQDASAEQEPDTRGGGEGGKEGWPPPLPPLSAEEQLTIAGQVNEFWRLLPAAVRQQPEYIAVQERAAAVRARHSDAGQQPLQLGQLLSSIEPQVAEAAALRIQAGWRSRQRRRYGPRPAAGPSGRGRSSVGLWAHNPFGCGCGLSVCEPREKRRR